MKHFVMALILTSISSMSLLGSENIDSLSSDKEESFELNEVIIVGKKPVFKEDNDKIVYLIKNDPYAQSLNAIEVLDRMPRVSIINENVTVAGKSSVRFILDGHLLESTEEAILLQLRNIPSGNIEKIELLSSPPAKYAASSNVAFIKITTRNETLGSRGNVWGNFTLQEKFNYRLGASFSHTTRKIELSADAGWQSINGINQLYRNFEFIDYTLSSNRITYFNDKNFGTNAIFKFKFNSNISSGAIFNFFTDHFKSDLTDMTSANNITYNSTNHSPSKPNNAVTFTLFADWKMDNKGKLLSLTYNCFNKDTKTESTVHTISPDNNSSVKDMGYNKYDINSIKLDATLPFDKFRLETGLSYTEINNNTDLRSMIIGKIEEQIRDIFNYSENTWGAYSSIDRQFSKIFYAKLGLRYEYSRIKGKQDIGFTENNYSFGRLLPSIVLNINTGKSGRFTVTYSMGISKPNFNDLNPFRYYTTTTDYFSGNPDLRPGISHNSELNYSFNGIYAVLYNNYLHNAIGYVTRFNHNGSQYSMPENFIDANKTGLYASYLRSLFSWWNLKLGGEIFYGKAKSNVTDFKIEEDKGWSGKVEINSSWMLDRKKTLLFNINFTHYFPYKERMVNYESFSLLGCDLRYSLINDKLNLALSVREPFGWNITKTKIYYQDYTLFSRNDIHSHAISFRISYSFGGNKVNTVYRDSKERESLRTY